VRRTDYDSIASEYEEDRRAWQVPPDEWLQSLLATQQSEVRVLEIGCGTGNWLAAQKTYFTGPRVRWHGVDPSQAMLEIAGLKLEGVALDIGRAEELPFSDGSFDFVASHLSFHHYEDKDLALDEIARVLAEDGVLSLFNVDPGNMPGRWIYHFFPETWQLDLARFWPSDRLAMALKDRGFAVEMTIETWQRNESLFEVLHEAKRRTLSQLVILEEEPYQRGLRDLQQAASDNPGGMVPSETAHLRLRAQRSSGEPQARRV
jgi:ubiquinone/menaquinone biosynthesis C-methylase UbiE